MVELFEKQIINQERQSSKGNQLKWCDGQHWYKANYTGYEGLTEYVISHLLQKSSLEENEFVLYELEDIHYKTQVLQGCRSKDFLKQDWQIITLERLFKTAVGESLNRCIYSIENHEERLRFIVEQTERITGLNNFGEYMSKLLIIDTFFLNEDRHTHNIAVLMNGLGEYDYCPIFDNGAGLLSDITMDYPLNMDVYNLEDMAKSKTFCNDFDEQLDIVEKLYGNHLKFYFTKKDVEQILEDIPYSDEIKNRVRTLVYSRMRKYGYLCQ